MVVVPAALVAFAVMVWVPFVSVRVVMLEVHDVVPAELLNGPPSTARATEGGEPAALPPTGTVPETVAPDVGELMLTERGGGCWNAVERYVASPET